MIPDQGRHLYKYLGPADRFVRVRLLDAQAAPLCIGPATNRAAYRRALIQACLPDFAEDIEGGLRSVLPADPRAAEDLLYQLCVQVNPGLDIHAVSLRATPPAENGAAAARASATAEPTSEERLARARGLEQRLAARILGQPRALAAVAAAVRRGAAGLAREDRPLASLLFVGRTGTGKSELAKVLARELFGGGAGSARPLVRIDCGEYALAHESSKLVGAPPGYVGHEEGGVLTEALRKQPECVVLFDEIEKAHTRMHHMLLQVLEEGELCDGRGRRARFDRAIVVLTSNAGAREAAEAARAIGFGGSRTLGERALGEITRQALERHFSPEFLGRIDETIVFRELSRADARAIAEQQLTELAVRLRRRGQRVEFASSLARWVAERGWSPESGAREIRRVIQREIEAPLADRLLEQRVGTRLRAELRGGALRLRAA